MKKLAFKTISIEKTLFVTYSCIFLGLVMSFYAHKLNSVVLSIYGIVLILSALILQQFLKSLFSRRGEILLEPNKICVSFFSKNGTVTEEVEIGFDQIISYKILDTRVYSSITIRSNIILLKLSFLHKSEKLYKRSRLELINEIHLAIANAGRQPGEKSRLLPSFFGSKAGYWIILVMTIAQVTLFFIRLAFFPRLSVAPTLIGFGIVLSLISHRYGALRLYKKYEDANHKLH